MLCQYISGKNLNSLKVESIMGVLNFIAEEKPCVLIMFLISGCPKACVLINFVLIKKTCIGFQGQDVPLETHSVFYLQGRQYSSESYTLTCIALYNYLRLTDNATYCPTGFEDSSNSTDELKEGEWRCIIKNHLVKDCKI